MKIQFMLGALAFSTLLTIQAFSSAMAEEARLWTPAFNQSTLTFQAQQMGASFKGSFQKYTTDIWFDPQHLDASRVMVDVDISSLNTEDKDRDKTATTAEWFDIAHFSSAKFVSTSFKKLESTNAYEANGTLTIKGISVPVTFPFTLDIKSDSSVYHAHVIGDVTLDRSKFNLGTGSWADVSVIANEVTVHIDLVAEAKK